MGRMVSLPPAPDLAALLEDLRVLTELESPSTDPGAIARVMDVAEAWALELGGTVQHLSGGTRRFAFGETGAARPLLLLAHADTVWPHGTLRAMPWRVEGDRAYGPGTYDMKAGLVGAFHALRTLAGGWPRGGVVLLLTPDEETGSASSREHIEAAARESRAALVLEPPVADTHALKVGRKGVGDLHLHFRGVASHAGNKPEEGASAITEAAHAVLAVQALARPELGTTVSVGRIAGGGAINVIPAECSLDADVRVATLAEADRVMAALEGLEPRDPRVTLTVTGGLNRPPFERGPGTQVLFEQAQAAARELGFEVTGEVVGGGSDGNFTAPLCPTLDGLGAPGDGAHAAHEHVRLDRWPAHVQLLTRLMQGL